jgi:hypothetical protein
VLVVRLWESLWSSQVHDIQTGEYFRGRLKELQF